MSYAARVSLQADAAEAQEMTAQIIYGTDFAAKRERESAEMEVASEALGYEAQMMHYSSCAVHNAPALPVGPCNCGGFSPAFPIHTGKEPA